MGCERGARRCWLADLSQAVGRSGRPQTAQVASCRRRRLVPARLAVDRSWPGGRRAPLELLPASRVKGLGGAGGRAWAGAARPLRGLVPDGGGSSRAALASPRGCTLDSRQAAVRAVGQRRCLGRARGCARARAWRGTLLGVLPRPGEGKGVSPGPSPALQRGDLAHEASRLIAPAVGIPTALFGWFGLLGSQCRTCARPSRCGRRLAQRGAAPKVATVT